MTQASAASWLAHHARTAVVFPYPAGAATSVSTASTPAAGPVQRRGRSTMPPRTPGAASLASISGGSAAAPILSGVPASRCPDPSAILRHMVA